MVLFFIFVKVNFQTNHLTLTKLHHQIFFKHLFKATTHFIIECLLEQNYITRNLNPLLFISVKLKTFSPDIFQKFWSSLSCLWVFNLSCNGCRNKRWDYFKLRLTKIIPGFSGCSKSFLSSCFVIGIILIGIVLV